MAQWRSAGNDELYLLHRVIECGRVTSGKGDPAKIRPALEKEAPQQYVYVCAYARTHARALLLLLVLLGRLPPVDVFIVHLAPLVLALLLVPVADLVHLFP